MSGVTYRTITLEIADSVAVLTLDRPDKLNAIVGAMHAELQDALTATESDARALIITGAGRGFCAGQDLSERRFAESDRPNLGAGLDRAYNPLIRRLRALPMPVIAAVNGVAAGAGMSLALAADIVLAARSATFIQAFAKLGLVPDAGSSYWLPRLVGPARAMALAMLAEPLPAEKAEAWGLIWKCVDDAALMDEANAMARHLAAQPTHGLALIKRAMNASFDNSLDSQLDLERDMQRIAGWSEDYREGVAAFLEKRPAVFHGR